MMKRIPLPYRLAAILAGALGAFSGCVTVDPAQEKYAESMAILEKGRESRRNGDTKFALTQFSEAVKINPDLAEGWYERGKLYVQMRLDPVAEGDVRSYEQKAIEDFSRAITKNPAYADAYFNRAMVYCSRAQYKPAVEDLFNASRFNARDPEPHLAMGQIYESKFEDKGLDAIQHYEKYVDLGGTDADAREKVKRWKELTRKPETPPPGAVAPQTKKPSPEDEQKAFDLYTKARDLLRQPDKTEAVKIYEQLLLDFGHTKFVEEKALAIKTAIVTFKKKEAPK